MSDRNVPSTIQAETKLSFFFENHKATKLTTEYPTMFVNLTDLVARQTVMMHMSLVL